jgi:hypothetical protein
MKSFSQNKQDIFVLEQTNFLKNGLFVDIAAGHPQYINNTFLLESEYQWDGISIEIDSKFATEWKSRNSLFLNEDAFKIDYTQIFNNLLKKHNKNNFCFNYLSLDLEPPDLTNKLLHILPLKTYKFDVITYEHDFYRVGNKYKIDAKDYLYSMGYKIIKENLEHDGHIYEDWYVFNND